MNKNHIIHKVSVEIDVENKEKAISIKDNITSFLTVNVFPKIEKYFDAFQETLTTNTIQISRLNIELNESNISLNGDLKNTIAKLLKKEVEEILKPELKPAPVKVFEQQFPEENISEISFLSEQDKLAQTFFFFIEKGYMPWWILDKNKVNILDTKLFKKIIHSKNFEIKMASLLQKSKVRERVINQLKDIHIKQLCLAVIKNKNLNIKLESFAITHLSSLKIADRNAFWSLILNIIEAKIHNLSINLSEYVTHQITTSTSILNLLEEKGHQKQIWNEIIKVFPFIEEDQILLNFKTKLSQKHLEKNVETAKKFREKTQNQENLETHQITSQQSNATDKNNAIKSQETVLQQNKLLKTKEDSAIKSNTPEEKEGFFIENAGLVLIHPFIKNLFMHCQLIDLKTQTLNNPELCVHLLHYIATGKTNQLESEMLFEKFLCNIPFQQSINRHIELSRQHKEHAKKVIHAVQQNWSAMKTASVGLIQNEFLQRPGKLVQNSNDHTLTMERKTQDIFLDKLSWGISFIKLPWQNEVIYINW